MQLFLHRGNNNIVIVLKECITVVKYENDKSVSGLSRQLASMNHEIIKQISLHNHICEIDNEYETYHILKNRTKLSTSNGSVPIELVNVLENKFYTLQHFCQLKIRLVPDPGWS